MLERSDWSFFLLHTGEPGQGLGPEEISSLVVVQEVE